MYLSHEVISGTQNFTRVARGKAGARRSGDLNNLAIRCARAVVPMIMSSDEASIDEASHLTAFCV